MNADLIQNANSGDGVSQIIATSLPSHTVASLFPMMSEADVLDLAGDIAENGLRESIWLHPDGSILDGRNRYLACQLAGVEPTFRTWNGQGSPVGFVVSLNLRRRHLDESQRALVAARIANLGEGRPSETAQISAVSQSDAADLLHVSRGSVQNAKRVLDAGALALVSAVERGDVAVSAATALTELDPEDQAAVVALPDAERREAIRDLREGRTPHVARNSGNNEWYTPAEIIEPARRVLGGIDLDPASSEAANRIVKATRIFTSSDDGLTQPWKGRVWMNPPYAQPLMTQFCKKLAASVRDGAVTAAIVLTNNGTETAWFQALGGLATAVCFPSGRVRCWHPEKAPTTPLQGQAVLYLGPKPATFHAVFSDLGLIFWTKP